MAFARLRPLLVSVSLLAMAAAAEARTRIAFVVGNSAYESQDRLNNPGNDAQDISALLRKLGFEVVEARDVTRRDFNRKRNEFTEKLEDMLAAADAGGDEPPIALFYYSGHGMQLDGTNYMIPVDARIEKPEDVVATSVSLDAVLAGIGGDDRAVKAQRAKKGLISMVILDACRNNPFARQVAKSRGLTRAAEEAAGGLAQVSAEGGAFIVYATDPGKVALDGAGRNSPFTAAFLQHAQSPGVEINLMMNRVRADVLNATQVQRPWASSSLTDQIFLGGRGEATVQQAALTTGAPQIGQQQSRHLTPPVPPRDAPQSRDAPKSQKSEAELAGDRCDAVATDKEDSLRSPRFKPVLTVNPDVAIPACEEAVKLNPRTPRFHNQLARAYDMGERHADAVRVLRIAADRGSSYAVASLGAYTYHGLGGMKRDYAQSRLWLEKAAALGAVRAQKYLAYLDAQGVGAPRNVQKAIDLYNRAVAAGDTSSMAWLANLYVGGAPDLEKDFAKARELYQRSADAEDPEGMHGLGMLAQYGYGEPVDFEKARKWYEKAAAYDSAEGMFALGELYNFGSAGVPKDQVTAKQWYLRAIQQKNTPSMYRLGEFALLGIAGDRNLEEARGHFERAIQRNFTAAMVYMADQHLEGTFGKVDREAARELLRRASELNDEIAQGKLASFDRKETAEEACDRLAASSVDPIRNPQAKPVETIDPDKAIPVCKEALGRNPNELRFANQLARGYLDKAMYSEALAVFLPAAEKKSAYAAMWVGNIYKRGLSVAKDPIVAQGWYEKAAAYGQRNAAYNLARMYLDGDEIARDYARARAVFERAAALGEPAASTELGHIYYVGKGVERDYRRARELYEKGAELGEAIAMYQLGVLYENGRGVAEDAARARLWYARGVEKGDNSSMRALASLYIGGKGGDREIDKARGLLEQAAAAGDAKAMTSLAAAYISGSLGPADPARGREWYEKAAGRGDAAAKRYLASLNADPAAVAAECDRLAGDVDDPLRSIEHPPARRVDPAEAVPACEAAVAANPDVPRHLNQLGRAYVQDQRYVDAMRVFRQAADEGAAFAMLWVGNLHHRGLGVPKDEAEGALWYEKAAEAGMLIAMYNLADYHVNRAYAGVDPGKHGALAVRWFERAAGLGHADAMYMMARLYDHGRIVTKDRAKELSWLNRAVQYNHGDALAQLASMHYTGEGLPKDDARSRDYARRGEAAGSRGARFTLGLLMTLGAGGPKDVEGARKLFEQNVRLNHVNTMLEYGRAIMQGYFGRPDPAKARSLFQRAADLGSAGAKAELQKLDAAPPARAPSTNNRAR